MLALAPNKQILNNFQLGEFLGAGTYGEVWSAQDRHGFRAALKFVRIAWGKTDRELRSISWVKNVTHPNVLPTNRIWLLDAAGNELDMSIDGISESRSPSFLVCSMPLAEQSLEDLLDSHLNEGQRGVPADELLGYMDETAKAIDFLNSPSHDLGDGRGKVAIYHRDIKPANILLLGGSAVIADLGIARAASESSLNLTTIGTPLYMAPECWMANQSLHRADQYSLAVLTYFYLRTNSQPFPADSNQYVVQVSHTTGQLDLSALPRAECAVIRRATTLDPAQRYGSCQEMIRELRNAASAEHSLLPGKPTHASDTQPVGDTYSESQSLPTTIRPRGRSRSLWIGAALMLLVLPTAWLTFTFLRDGRSDSRSTTKGVSPKMTNAPNIKPPADTDKPKDELAVLQEALDAVVAAHARWERLTRDESDPESTRDAGRSFYSASCRLGQLLQKPSEDTDRRAAIEKRVSEFLRELNQEPAKLEFIARGGRHWLTNAEMSPGILIVGNVLGVRHQGKSFETRLKLTEDDEVVLLTSQDPKDLYVVGERIVALGVVERTPSKVPQHDGSHAVVVQASITCNLFQGAGDYVGQVWDNNELKMALVWIPAGSFLMGSSNDNQEYLTRLKQTEMSLKAATAATQLAKNELDRAKKLYEFRALSQSELDRATRNLSVAKEKETEARQAVDRAKKNPKRQFSVTLSRGYWMGKHEVTQEQWMAVTGTEPWKGEDLVQTGSRYPVTCVSWNDAVEFCRKLTKSERGLAGWKFDLPTEAQWEYACRAGTTGRFSFGDVESELSSHGWYSHNSKDSRFAHLVGQKKANAWGLHDTHGNVREWCRDNYSLEAPRGTDPLTVKGTGRVNRGGSWYDQAPDCQAATREKNLPSDRHFNLGFRVALVPPTR